MDRYNSYTHTRLYSKYGSRKSCTKINTCVIVCYIDLEGCYKYALGMSHYFSDQETNYIYTRGGLLQVITTSILDGLTAVKCQDRWFIMGYCNLYIYTPGQVYQGPRKEKWLHTQVFQPKWLRERVFFKTIFRDISTRFF